MNLIYKTKHYTQKTDINTKGDIMISIQYPALIYKSKKNNVFIANCIIKNLIGYGHTQEDAVLNLEKVLNNLSKDYPVKVKPVYQFLPELATF